MKRMLTLLLAAMLLLSACGRPAAPAETPAPTAAPTATPSPTPSPTPTPTPAPTPTPTPTPPPEVSDDTLVVVRDYIPSLYVDLRYATERNCTGTAFYDLSDAMLRYGTVKKLQSAQEALLAQGYSLKIWDAYRPVRAQFRLWEICPDVTYVANPYTGFSNHSRGNTVDITLVRSDGSAVEMPSDFDEFSPLADRDYSDVSQTAADNAILLEQAMTAAGFTGYSGEWWHYSDTVSYPVVTD